MVWWEPLATLIYFLSEFPKAVTMPALAFVMPGLLYWLASGVILLPPLSLLVRPVLGVRGKFEGLGG